MENKDRDHPFTSFFHNQPIQNNNNNNNNNNSAIQNPNPRDAPNLYPSIPRNLNRSEYPRINNTPTLEEVKSAMGGIFTSNNIRYNFGYYNMTPLALVAKDPNGCSYLQAKIYEGKENEVDVIISQVKPHLHELMMHPYASFLIQCIFQQGSTMDYMDSIVFSIILDEQKLKNVCMDHYGTLVIQKMLEKIHYPLAISRNLYTMVVRTIRRIAVQLMKDVNGSYIILQCMKSFSPIAQKIILDELATNCVEIATDQTGSSVIQKCLTHAEGGAKIQLFAEIISNAIVLADHPFGNYVLKYLIELKLPSVSEMVIRNLSGRYVQLSMNKYASNVVEVLLQLSRHAAFIVLEIMESNNFLSVLQDPFGNYVAQSALKYTKGRLHRELSDKIKAHHKNLQNHPYGKKVLAKADAKRNRFLNGSQSNF